MKYIALDNLNIKDNGVLFVRLKLSLGSDFAMFFFLAVLLLALRILDSGICKSGNAAGRRFSSKDEVDLYST